ncbi:MAG: class I SAM-dependent methyltransferase [Ekhidna sp.]
MYTKLEKCPSCGHPKFKNHIICEDHTVSNESFALVKCDNCELVFTNPRPSIESISSYYQSDQYISHTDKANSAIHLVYKLVREYTLSQKLKLISSYKKKGTILDYGTGTGDFLEKCFKNNWTTFGYEPDLDALKIAKSKGKSEFIESLPTKSKVDIITAWHVIEHVYELVDTIRNLKKSLNDDGYMFIALPNIESFDAKEYQEFWAAYDVPRHLYHFSQSSFKQLLGQEKLKLIDVKPMIFDSYYVSLLSEKYKTGKSNIINAVRNGYYSNKSAKKTGQYSSLIYVVKK